ncbi:MAG: radical SAM protein [Bacteroidales bacterium]|nr:radical SAM protein [Bacteroidales bacterium]
MKILLISLQDNREQLGLKFLHYNLLANNYDSRLFYLKYFDRNSNKSIQSISAFFKDLNPSLVGVSLMSIDYHRAVDITSIIRSSLPGIPVIWGGIHPTIYPEMCLQYADYVSIGESEQSVLQIAEALKNNLSFESVNNLAYKKNGRIVKNPLFPQLNNLDKVEPYEHIPVNCYVLENNEVKPLTKKLFKKYDKTAGNSYTVMSSRGCPYSCTYCCNNFNKNLYNNKLIRRRSVAHIINELEKAIKDYPELDFFNFEDDSFLSCSLDYLKEFCEAYAQKIHIPLIVHSIPISISEEKILLLKKAGLAWINVGLQSASDNTLINIYERKSMAKDFFKAADILKKHKVAAFYDVLVDNPYETEEDKIQTLLAVDKIPKPYIIRVFSLTFYPGSKLYDRFVADHPEKTDAYLEKNFCMPDNDNYNQLIKMLPFLFGWHSHYLIKKYIDNPLGKSLSKQILFAKLLNLIFIKPIRLIGLIHMSYQGSYLKTFFSLHRYFRHYMGKHLPHIFQSRNSGVLPF